MEFLDLFGIGDWLVESVTNVLRRASFWLCEQVYPLIPKLYEIVEVLAKYTFFTDETISKISRNIYILVSVLMLFALGIKLLSAIVNPENFSGDKGSKGKSFKATFFRSVTAVFLIILTPMFFNTAYDVQDHVISNSLVERILLGVDLEGDTSGGQILAGYSLSTFFHPASEEYTNNSEYNEVINENIDKIDTLEPYINIATSNSSMADAVAEAAEQASNQQGRTIKYEFNGLLCPAVGILIVYELILLAMDLGLRSVKLGLLQLMSPIVIASYIFKGEILSKWFKEVLSTYLICFLKIAAITFMVFGMTELSGFLSRPELDPLSAGAKRITQLFIMIGLLQVIKLIPNIINGIFGTNIQSRGGIKGRLGEMAAVGGLAQKAWDALKTPALKIAGLGLAAGTFGLGGLAALGAGGWAAHKTWNKGWGTKGPLKDTKFGRAVRTVGAGGSAVGTALTTKGGLFKTISAGKKKYDDAEVTKTRKLERAQKNRSNAFKNFNIGDNGLLNSINNINNALAEGRITANQAKQFRKNAAQYEFDKIRGKALDTYKDAKGIGFPGVSKIVSDQENLKYSASNKEHGEIVKKKYDAVKTELESMISKASSEGNTDLSDKLSLLKSDLLTKKISMPQLIYELDKMSKNGEGVARGDFNKIKADGTSFWNEFNASQYAMFDKDGNVLRDENGKAKLTSLAKLIPTSADGGIVITELFDKISEFDTDLESKKSQVDKRVAAFNYNDEQKEIVGAVTNNIIATAKALAGADSKIDYAQNIPGDSSFVGPLPASTPQPAQQQPQPAPQQQPNPQPAQNVPDQSGYDDYLDWNDAGGDQSSQPVPQPTSRPRPSSNNTSSTSDTGGYDDYVDYNDNSNDSSSGNNQQGGSNESNNTNNGQGVASGGGSINGANINVTADVDLKELSDKLDTINQSITSTGSQVSGAVNSQGGTIADKLDTANDHLRTMDKNIQTMTNNKDDDE